MKHTILKVINNLLSPFNAKITKSNPKNSNFQDLWVSAASNCNIIDLAKLSSLSANIKGMIDHRAGEELFALTYMQALTGDVIEIGSYQGRSTFFLGTAVKFSGNGKLYAIDHFKGNLGKEKLYVVQKNDLSDLEAGFRKNIENSGLSEVVDIINKSNEEAAYSIRDNTVRMLFIDGDHTPEGVTKDLNLFFPKLKVGGIIVFDDYDPKSFEGLVKVVNSFIESKKHSRSYLLGRTMVVQL